MKFIYILSLILGLSVFANAEGKHETNREEFKVAREKVTNACSQELTTSGCQPGKGVMKCVKKYYKDNKANGAQLSENCKSALKEMRALRKEKQNNKAADHDNHG